MSRHTSTTVNRARFLRQAKGMSYSAIGRELGVKDVTTVHCWCDPAFASRQRKRNAARARENRRVAPNLTRTQLERMVALHDAGLSHPAVANAMRIYNDLDVSEWTVRKHLRELAGRRGKPRGIAFTAKDAA